MRQLLRREKRALVLGCGPSGLFAAHALATTGWQVEIISKKRPSQLYGAQYLHQPIPGLTPDEPVIVDYQLKGSADDYAKKVYGNNHVGFVSPEKLVGEHPAWDIRATYRAAYERYEHLITDKSDIDVDWAREQVLSRRYRAVISTVPRPLLCFGRCQFSGQDVWAVGDAPDRGHYVPFSVPANTVVCSGERDTGWYRASNVFGHKTVEWPFDHKPPLSYVAQVTKPVSHQCNCWVGVPFMYFEGRFGAWAKDVLSHQAFYNTWERFS